MLGTGISSHRAKLAIALSRPEMIKKIRANCEFEAGSEPARLEPKSAARDAGFKIAPARSTMRLSFPARRKACTLRPSVRFRALKSPRMAYKLVVWQKRP